MLTAVHFAPDPTIVAEVNAIEIEILEAEQDCHTAEKVRRIAEARLRWLHLLRSNFLSRFSDGC